MRRELLWKPGLLCERIGYKARQHRRLQRLRGTVASGLSVGHIESLELLELARPLGIETIYDVGANVGTWTLLAKAVIPEARVHAFEPLSKHCAQFGQNLAGIEGVHLHPIALGAESGRATLRVADFSDASSILPLAEASRLEFGVSEVDQIEVEVQGLDDFRFGHKLPFPDIIKLDVQGFELQVLRGARECLSHAKAIVMEVSFRKYYEGQREFHLHVSLLAELGLFAAAFSDHTPMGALLGQTDMLFLRWR